LRAVPFQNDNEANEENLWFPNVLLGLIVVVCLLGRNSLTGRFKKLAPGEHDMERLAFVLGAFACLGLVDMSAYGQINIGGGGNRGNSGANIGQGFAKGEGSVKAKGQDGNSNNEGRRSSGNNNNRDGFNIGGRDGINIDPGKNGISIDSQRNKDRDNFRKDNDRHRDDLTKRSRIGDGNWDKFGIGRLDDSRYRNSSGNQWRYKKYGNDWFYWTPTGYWMFYGNGRWNRYDPDVYATYYYGDGYVPQQVVPTNFNGPYYEDSNGFYYLNGNQRVYDPTIRRQVNAVVN
jgi:hypothetical protein